MVIGSAISPTCDPDQEISLTMNDLVTHNCCPRGLDIREHQANSDVLGRRIPSETSMSEFTQRVWLIQVVFSIVDPCSETF